MAHRRRKNWFEQLTGVEESSPEAVRSALRTEGKWLHSTANSKAWQCGTLSTPQLSDLRFQETAAPGHLTFAEVVADVRELHADASNAGATFQVASQFNLLEMVSPRIAPEDGIGIYENDRTQGPACAIACGAGTIYRNYFAPVDGQPGQSFDRQIDCLADVGARLGNVDSQLWAMKNGYALPTSSGLQSITSQIDRMTDNGREELRGLLRVGLQSETQVTLANASHTVDQVYCSALPVAYSNQLAEDWEVFARLVLEAAYEATFRVAARNAARTGNNRLYLTLLGGGAFGNRQAWILDAIDRAARLLPNCGLNVFVVSYGSSSPSLCEFLRELNRNLRESTRD